MNPHKEGCTGGAVHPIGNPYRHREGAPTMEGYHTDAWGLYELL